MLTAGHFGQAGTLADAEIADGLTARVPSGYVSVNGIRAGLRRRAPRVGEHDGMPLSTGPERPALDLGPPLHRGDGPLAGLRVLDLGVIVFGAELSRLFADQGADATRNVPTRIRPRSATARPSTRITSPGTWRR